MASPRKTPAQHFALDFLREYYQPHAANKHIFSRPFIKTKRGHEADGLLAFQNKAEQVVTVAVEAKSAKNLNFISHRSTLETTLLQLIFAGIIAAAFYAATPAGTWLKWFFPVLAFVPSYFLCGYLFRKLLHNKLSKMLRQLSRCPADEKWLVLNLSSRKLSRNPWAEQIFDTCRAKGIGVLTIGERKKITIAQAAQQKPRRDGDFLSFYKQEKEIRQELINPAGYAAMRVA